MRLLLVQDTVWVPSWGGANKFNRTLLEDLAQRGHECRAITPSHGSQAAQSVEAFCSELTRRSIEFNALPDVLSFVLNGVTVDAIRDRRQAEPCIARTLRDFAPDWILVASEDPAQRLLAIVLRHTSRVVYLARTTLVLPFGPHCAMPSQRGTQLLHSVAGVIVVSEFLRDYFKRWAGIESTIVPISPSGPGPFPSLGNFDSGFVMMVNPCLYKGLPIFLKLAKAMPDVSFAAVPTWGTTQDDLEQLKQLPHMTLIHARDEFTDILKDAKVLLCPSLWAEAKGMVIFEAMLHGIPVIASAVGGIPEAKLGVDYLIPVNPITGFLDEFDEKMLPIPCVPEQDLRPWVAALRELTSNRAVYDRLSLESRQAAMIANESEDVKYFEYYLETLNRADYAGSAIRRAGTVA
jgi:glycosyltransferase involved in cell wall biosynthesis